MEHKTLWPVNCKKVLLYRLVFGTNMFIPHLINLYTLWNIIILILFNNYNVFNNSISFPWTYKRWVSNIYRTQIYRLGITLMFHKTDDRIDRKRISTERIKRKNWKYCRLGLSLFRDGNGNCNLRSTTLVPT
jgi:hypothetical protein